MLVAITKTCPLDYVKAAYGLGVRHFGENRVAEAADKLPYAKTWLAGRDEPTWHMVGHLQRRKVGEALRLFDLIHSVDSLRLAQRIDRLCRREERSPMPVLLEVNTSGELQKAGFQLHRSPDDPDQWAGFLALMDEMIELPHLDIRGFMTMAPLADPETARPCFRRLAKIGAAFSHAHPDLHCSELSMGMSNDFEVAVEEGATMVRLGQAIFGPREGH
jgi:pyridoxal phosphate enzyme (YggS family)